MNQETQYDILVVDDNHSNLRLLTEILTDAGYKVRPVADGKTTLMTAFSKPPDLILLDIRIPDMSGYEICGKLKSDRRTMDIPVIFISALNEVLDKVKAFSLGGVDYITKPLQAEEVVARVKTQMNLRSLQKNLQEQNAMLQRVVGERLKVEEELVKKTIQLEELNKTLAEKVAFEVQKNMENEMLMSQQSKLASMGEMLGVIAHQWKQPINAISLIAFDVRDAYEHGDLNNDYLFDSMKQIREQVTHMAETMNDFLEFFKPSKEKVPFKLNTAIKKTIILAQYQLKKMSIGISLNCTYEKNGKTIHYDLPNEICSCTSEIEVQGYPNEFKQVILNLINNAKDAILNKRGQATRGVKEGRIDLELSYSNGKAIIRVKDNGGGIKGDIIEHIFEPFFTHKESGMGIGLYMAKVIIEKHMGGKMYAENDEDGAVFIIELDGDFPE